MHPLIDQITRRIHERSRARREAYLLRIDEAVRKGPRRGALSCSNLAHGYAGCPVGDKEELRGGTVPLLGIVSAYNDMLSAHKPYETYPQFIRQAARERGAAAQVAGAVPAMCDGVTQGQAGMEFSLFSRDVIAMATGVALSHDMFDAALFLGICDKIVPGLVIGALAHGHLPAVFVPAGPMPTGISNEDKSKVRARFARGEASRDELLASESAAYHAPGTCTFYGTANSNQFLMEVMGLHMPGAAFVPPDDPLRAPLTEAAVVQALAITREGQDFRPLGRMLDEKSFVNAIVGLHATGGSTNHTLHLIAMAAAAGITLTWEDMGDLSEIVPLITRIYPNGPHDVNVYHAAGGTAHTIGALLDARLLWPDVKTVVGDGLEPYGERPQLGGNQLFWSAPEASAFDERVVRPVNRPFRVDGGLKVLKGNLGRAVIKVSALDSDRLKVRAPARVFHSQEAFNDAFAAGELEQDFVAVIRFQGASANGMPELHALTPALGVLQDRGFKVALVTDGRMSGASGRVPAAIHVTPEAVCKGAIARVRDGDVIEIDATKGRMNLAVNKEELAARPLALDDDAQAKAAGFGRELFAGMRELALPADQGGGWPLSV